MCSSFEQSGNPLLARNVDYKRSFLIFTCHFSFAREVSLCEIFWMKIFLLLFPINKADCDRSCSVLIVCGGAVVVHGHICVWCVQVFPFRLADETCFVFVVEDVYISRAFWFYKSSFSSPDRVTFLLLISQTCFSFSLLRRTQAHRIVNEHNSQILRHIFTFPTATAFYYQDNFRKPLMPILSCEIDSRNFRSFTKC